MQNWCQKYLTNQYMLWYDMACKINNLTITYRDEASGKRGLVSDGSKHTEQRDVRVFSQSVQGFSLCQQ